MSKDDDAEDGEDLEPIKFGRALELAYDGAFWTGGLRLRSLDKLVHDDDHEILVEIEADGDLSKGLRAGLTWLVATEKLVADALLDGIVAAFPAMRARAVKVELPDLAEMPATLTRKTIARHVDVVHLTLHDVVNGRKPYLGFECGCAWEREHGIGVLMHGTRIVEIGDADVALDEYKPAADARKQKRKRAR